MPDGSTAVSCLLQPPRTPGGARRLLVANLGDSRCALVRADGSAVALSVDHKPNRPDERERVVAAGGHVIFAGCWRVQGDLAVSRAFGDSHLKSFGVSAEPELSRVDLAEGDTQLILASDGLWDVVDEAQCGSLLRHRPEPLDAARALCEMASQRGSMDNITVLVVNLA
jgi:protein phosphatase 1L